MQCRGVFVHYCCRLGSAIASRVVEIHCVDTILAKRTPKFGAAIHRFGRVISHFLNCRAFCLSGLGAKGVCTFGVGRCRLKWIPQTTETDAAHSWRKVAIALTDPDRPLLNEC